MSAKPPVETVAQTPPQAPPEAGSTVPSAPPGGRIDATVVKSAGAPAPAGAPDIAGYAITHEIARGGMGVVYAATDLTFGRAVAVKTTLHGVSADAFVREAEITARLAHPGIPPVHALGTLPDGRPFLVMKLIRGDTFDVVLKRSRLEAERTRLLAVFEQLCHAIGYAHAQGFVHRDLKPSNVMVGEFGDVQAMDWGLAKRIGAAVETTNPIAGTSATATLAGDVKGTPAYMAPEQARGEPVDVRADVFALGGILCAILTGRAPFFGNSVMDTIIRAGLADLADTFARVDASGAAPELIAVCRTCLAAKPADRYADGTAVAQAVAAYRAGVEERTQRAERDRAAAEARAAEEANTRREAEARAEAERAARTEAEARAEAEAKTRREQRKRSRAQLLLACAALLLVAAGGAFAWYSADRQAKEAQLEGEKKASDTRANTEAEYKEKQARQGIDVNLQLSTNMRKVYNFPEADRLLVQALEFAKSGAPDRRAEVERARSDLAFVVKLDDIRFRKWMWASVASGKGGFSTKIASPEYSAAFATFGIDLKVVDPAAAATRITASAVKAELVAAVDDWALYEPDTELSERLLDVARRADPDRWRDRLRDPKLRVNKRALAQLAKEADVRTVAPAALSVLAELMERRGLDPAERLTAACAAHPREFELAFARGLWHDDGTDGEQIGPYEAARALRPENPAVWNNLGKALEDKGDTDGAIAAYNRAIELAPNRAAIHSNLGRALSHTGDLDGAIAAYKRAIELDPTYAKAHNNFGIALKDKGNLDGAIAAYKRAIELDPTAGFAQYNLGIALKEKRDLDGAIAAYTRAIELDPNDAQAHNNLGLVLEDKDDLNGALAVYKRAIELDPTYAKIHNNLGAVLRRKGDLKGAIAAYQRAIELDPTYAKAHSNLGVALSAKGDSDGATAAYKRAIEYDPNDAQTHHNLGVALKSKRDIDGAIAAHKRAVELDPTYAQAYNSLGIALKAKGDLGEAVAAYQRAIELDPNDAPTHNNLGVALEAKGDLNGALAEYKRSIELDSKSALAHNNLGIALKAKGDLDGAIVASKRATELDPTYAFAHYNLGIALKAKGDLDGAAAAYNRAIELDLTYAKAHNNLGWIYLQQKKYAECVACARAAIRAEPTLSNAHALLGLALRDAGNIPAARAALTEAARLDKKWAANLAKLPPIAVAPAPREKP